MSLEVSFKNVIGFLNSISKKNDILISYEEIYDQLENIEVNSLEDIQIRKSFISPISKISAAYENNDGMSAHMTIDVKNQCITSLEHADYRFIVKVNEAMKSLYGIRANRDISDLMEKIENRGCCKYPERKSCMAYDNLDYCELIDKEYHNI